MLDPKIAWKKVVVPGLTDVQEIVHTEPEQGSKGAADVKPTGGGSLQDTVQTLAKSLRFDFSALRTNQSSSQPVKSMPLPDVNLGEVRIAKKGDGYVLVLDPRLFGEFRLALTGMKLSYDVSTERAIVGDASGVFVSAEVAYNALVALMSTVQKKAEQ